MTPLGALIPEMLVERGITTVFGIPGVHTVEMYRGLPGSGLRHVTPRHEQGAGFMADGYWRASGKVAACFIITGPGMTNIATAMGQAYGDSVPMLVISSVNAEAEIGSGAGHLHELPDQLALTAGVAAWSRQVRDAAELAEALDDAMDLFTSARPRPVHIQIPIDRLSTGIALSPPPRTRATPPVVDDAVIGQVADLLNGASRPLLILGGGARNVNGLQLAEALGAPVLMTANASGHLPPDHPLHAGGTLFADAQRDLIVRSDVVLALGCEFGPTDWTFYGEPAVAFSGTSIRVDIDAAHLTRGPIADHPLVADAAAFAEALLPLITRAPAVARDLSACHRARCEALEARIARHVPLLDAIWEASPDAIIAGDSTEPAYAGLVAARPPRLRQWFTTATGFGTLGYGLPAAIGAKLAQPDAPVIALAGDGGALYTIAELAAAAEIGLPVVLLIWNNDGYGEIRHFMEDGQIEPEGVALSPIDFAALAKGFGGRYVRADTLAAICKAIGDACNGSVPVVIEMREGDAWTALARPA
ncbi:MAG: 5-guanidino-2-oxopentanoate decarboxylase [Pseudomonadota bacterium]